MNISYKAMLLGGALAACNPSVLVLPPGADAGPARDAADHPSMAGDVVDAGGVDVAAAIDAPAAVDAPAADVRAVVDAPLETDVPLVFDAPITPDIGQVPDLPIVSDVPGPVDASVGVDVPAVVDATAPIDAGSCPAGMALIPSGAFLMGDTDPASLNARPPHRVTVSAFCMDLTEVTVAAYGTCTAPGCTAPGTAVGCNQGVAGRGSHPINCVDWSQSRAFCRSRGGDLPTEAQWEYGARGTDGRAHPWGNAAPTTQLCWSGVGTRSSTCPVQTFPAGNSPFGLFDMAGNLLEWTADWYATYAGAAATDPAGPPSGTSRVDRGGGWDATSATQVRSPSRWGDNPTDRYPVRGFRCVRAPL